MNEDLSDHEMTRLAAMAAGYDWVKVIDYKPLDHQGFNPLGDDGDALRLVAVLRLNLEYDAPNYVTAWNHEAADYTHMVAINDDLMGATRKAIVRAAAEIGRRMKDEQSTID